MFSPPVQFSLYKIGPLLPFFSHLCYNAVCYLHTMMRAAARTLATPYTPSSYTLLCYKEGIFHG